MAKPTPSQVIQEWAPKLGLDWRAVYAYMMEESGGDWNAVGDHGTSFGPFQMHRGGALGSHSAGWAMSPAGLIAGMKMMAANGAAGKTGAQALWSIYQGFGKGTDDQAAFNRAYPYLTGNPGRQQGFYVNPVPSGSTFERNDQGIDWRGKPGQEVVALGASRVIRISKDAGGFGIAIYLKLMEGPWAGRVWYIGHTVPTVKVGQVVAAGAPVAMLLQHPLGNASGIPGHTEIGWATSNGSGPKYGMGSGGAGGLAFHQDLESMGIGGPGSGTASEYTYGTDVSSMIGNGPVPLTPADRAHQAANSLDLSVDTTVQEPDTQVFDPSQMWQTIAAQDNISPETQQVAAQYVGQQMQGVGFDMNPFRPQPIAPSPGPTGA